jgi:allophycocyanin-B
MSIVKQVILSADEELRYPTPSEIGMIQNFCRTGDRRLRVASVLADNEAKIVQKGSRRFWELCPNTPSNSGVERKTSMCLRDMGWYIRVISYCLLAGNEKPLAEIGTVGVREMYNSLGIPLSNLVMVMYCLKDEAIALLSPEEAVEVTAYFEYIIKSLSNSSLEILTPGAVRDELNSDT